MRYALFVLLTLALGLASCGEAPQAEENETANTEETSNQGDTENTEAPAEKVFLTYNELESGTILTKNLDKSPEDNVKEYLSEVGAEFAKIRFQAADGNCDCADEKSGSCYCKLPNAVSKGISCGTKESCKIEKIVYIEVNAADKALFAEKGFK